MHTTCYLIIEADQVIGYLMLSCQHGIVDVVRLCIFSPYRNKGYGYETLYRLVHHPKARGLIFTLHVSVVNYFAHHLYQKVGFKGYASQLGYYRDGSPAECMYYDTRYLVIFAALIRVRSLHFAFDASSRIS